jgi:hypothetical protein
MLGLKASRLPPLQIFKQCLPRFVSTMFYLARHLGRLIASMIHASHTHNKPL